MKNLFLLILLLFGITSIYAQKKYIPVIEDCGCDFAIDSNFVKRAPAIYKTNTRFELTVDSSFKLRCGYLIVPENRQEKNSKMIRLPFIVLKSKNPNAKKDPLLFTSGGPGNSSLSWVNGIQRSPVIEDRDCIAFEQRGTKFAIPYLRFFELDDAMKVAYRNNLDKDSAWIEAIKQYKKAVVKAGIDINGYNSDETVADIIDLVNTLKIDSINLLGGSYSGGLMMAVAKKAPTKVRSVIMDSPLPMFSPIDEDEPVNFIESLKLLSTYVDRDSADKQYHDLFNRFDHYFRDINNKTFYLSYYDSLQKKSLNIAYGKNELLDIIVGAMLKSNNLKEVASITTDIIEGKHDAYIHPKIDRIIRFYPHPDGMRMLVYCADQAAYHRQEIIQQLYQLYPYLTGYRINDVWKEVCDCWKNKPIAATTKQPFYTNTPMLIADGEMDAACRPLYMYNVKHYSPNAQCFLFLNRSHGVGGKTFSSMMQAFLNNPIKKIEVVDSSVKAYP